MQHNPYLITLYSGIDATPNMVHTYVKRRGEKQEYKVMGVYDDWVALGWKDADDPPEALLRRMSVERAAFKQNFEKC
jgi:hypothetical protein